jgi:hypothetical protein
MSSPRSGSSSSRCVWRRLCASTAWIALALFAIAPLARAGVDAEPPIDFAARQSTEHFEIACVKPLALEALGAIAEDTQRRLRTWLGVPAPAVEKKIHVYICRDVETLFTLEASFGLPSSREFHRGHPFHGRCYPEAGLIVIPLAEWKPMCWQVVHEVTHTVFQEIVGRNVEIVNEGLAEIVPYWILQTNEASPEGLDARYDLYDYRCAQALLTREVPEFGAFTRSDANWFYDPNTEWLGYSLAWKFVKMLVESDHPRVRGRFVQFLRVLGAGNAVWPSLRAVYDTELLDVLWRAEVERSARWKPLFGQWRLDAGAIVGAVVGRHSSAALTSSHAWPGESFTLGFTLGRIPAPGIGFGFALEVTGEDDFVYVEFRPSGHEISIARRSQGVWTELYEYELPSDVDMLAPIGEGGRRIRLEADASGLLRVHVDNELVLRHDLGRELVEGGFGVMLERCDPEASDNAYAEIRFNDVSIKR